MKVVHALLGLLAFFLAVSSVCAATSSADRSVVPKNGPLVAEISGCTIELGIECSQIIVQCYLVCKEYKSDPSDCFSCLGSQRATCCPCLTKTFGSGFPCQ
ncbi:uncharacterized protein ACA1_138290 [Acanthamoeba castellanii str. Neff]|uniref:Uncharacterized protein n=1 Tax=Acanthamoeba castellanii (strain ATCC 30010 / Neff) TaxID=1257118 RepID=L8GZK6_ACACF|nr:uncharacterized protein ACA1_138290 [Acanthamoeba castellanii str. Neff]ELR18407.1 hypothetical protein ACA1_138290 [Acanthamoeba castellanii str. Neff]